jgi:hypothetical protein
MNRTALLIVVLLGQNLGFSNESTVEESNANSYVEIANRAVSARKSITSYHIVVSSNAQSSENGWTGQAFYRDGNRQRLDAFFENVPEDTGITADPFVDVLILTGAERISYSTRRYKGGMKSAIQSDPPSVNEILPNIHGFGMNVNALRGNFSAEDGFFHSNASRRVVTEALLDGTPCKLLIEDYKGGTGKVWIAPNMGWSPIKFEYLREKPNHPRLSMVSIVKVAEYETSGIWFPTLITYEHREGGAVIENLEWKVEAKSLNKGLPDSLFQLSSLGAPANTEYYRNPESQTANLIWDGSKVVESDKRSDPNDAGQKASQWKGMTVVIAAGAVLFFGVAVYSILRYSSGRDESRQ